jgi:hypothetical protein
MSSKVLAPAVFALGRVSPGSRRLHSYGYALYVRFLSALFGVAAYNMARADIRDAGQRGIVKTIYSARWRSRRSR